MKEYLKNIGLDETEALVYLAMLELGPATVTEITRKAGITRTLGYHVLEKLGWHGLVDCVSGKDSVLRYTVEHPRRVLQFGKSKRNELDNHLKELEQSLPLLVSLYKVAEKPTVRYQEGLAGLKSIYLDTLQSKTEILSIVDLEAFNQPALKQFAKNYTRERGKRRIHERLLILNTPAGRQWLERFSGSFRYTHYRWIESDQLPSIVEFGGELNIYENKVMMALMKKQSYMGIFIESSALSNILRGLFELAWVQGRKEE